MFHSDEHVAGSDVFAFEERRAVIDRADRHFTRQGGHHLVGAQGSRPGLQHFGHKRAVVGAAPNRSGSVVVHQVGAADQVAEELPLARRQGRDGHQAVGRGVNAERRE